MTASLNRIQLIGNLGADPKSITGKDGNSFVTATLATNESFKQNDEWQTRIEWEHIDGNYAYTDSWNTRG